jgi:hypothetical protein
VRLRARAPVRLRCAEAQPLRDVCDGRARKVDPRQRLTDRRRRKRGRIQHGDLDAVESARLDRGLDLSRSLDAFIPTSIVSAAYRCDEQDCEHRRRVSPTSDGLAVVVKHVVDQATF